MAARCGKIPHGRRKGLNRLTPETRGEVPVFPNISDLKNVTVLPRAEWDRMQDHLTRGAVQEAERQKRIAERKQLHEKSMEQVKHWSNTIKGAQQKSLAARKQRAEKIEEERRLIDVEEAEYQAAERKAAIDKARTQLYYETDRVKSFHGALLLTEVLKERDAQIELKRTREMANMDEDKHWAETLERMRESDVLNDQALARERIDRVNQTAKFQKAQIAGHEKAREKMAADALLEGAELKRLAAQYKAEREKLEAIAAAETKQAKSENLQQLKDNEHLRKIHAQMDEEEDEESRLFAAAKRKMVKLRLQKEAELYHEKQDQLDRIRAKLTAQLKQKQDNEDERIKKAINEREAKLNAELTAKAETLAKVQADINKHRLNELERAELEKSEKRLEELHDRATRREADAVFHLNEEEREKKKKADNKTTQDFLVEQTRRRHCAEKAERETGIAQDRHNMSLLQLEEDQFQEYARGVIANAEANGRNTYPLRARARRGAGGGSGPALPDRGGIRPNYMAAEKNGDQLPSWQSAETNEIKNAPTGDVPTHKRLGFVW